MSKINNTKKKISKKAFAAVTFAAVFFVSTGVAAANGHLDGIIKTFTTGSNYFFQVDPNAEHELPEKLKGKIYNAEGESLNAVNKDDMNNLYDENGNLLDTENLKQLFSEALADEGVEMGIYEYDETNVEDLKIIYSNIEDAQKAADFDIKVPEYIPEGFEFANISAYKDENGNASGLYRDLEYTNGSGKKFSLSERLINEETAFAAGSDGEMEEIEINGRKTVITNNSSLHFETEDNVSVSIFSKGSITKDELIKMAESIK